ncbi:MAG: hypothetical protein JOZ78_22785 [Chroococcidiopsidaceae cyanobacterium CP_BM_ER_R8_30]|nr:hypothetical protein [Chroococcidiopsidaceae cyanobacterium CP_BM_ER_R8_30]
MRKAIVLVLSTTLILFASQKVGAQLGVSEGPSLVLVKGDNLNKSLPICSFISATQLVPVPLVSRLLSIQLGNSPEQVGTEMGFTPDAPYSRSLMTWTSELGGQYIRAEVAFRNQQVWTRTVTMATNYERPNERMCSWEVRALQEELQRPAGIPPGALPAAPLPPGVRQP